MSAKNTTKKQAGQKVTRKLEQPKYATFKLHKRIKHPEKIPSGFIIFVRSIQHIFRYKKLFLGILCVYTILSLVFVTGLFANSQFTSVKQVLDGTFNGFSGELATGVALFSLLVSGGVSASSEAGGVYQILLMMLMSLTVIWVLRQTHAKQKVAFKLAFYKSTFPLVPFLLVLIVIGLQFLPLLAGTTVYSVVLSQGLAITFLEKFLWGLIVGCLGLLTLYMVSSSIFALYIVTLPGVYPMKSLRSARELVRHRRWAIMRKVVFLPLILFVGAAVIMFPVLLFITPIAQWVFLTISIFGVMITHTYMYKLYRELL